MVFGRGPQRFRVTGAQLRPQGEPAMRTMEPGPGTEENGESVIFELKQQKLFHRMCKPINLPIGYLLIRPMLCISTCSDEFE